MYRRPKFLEVLHAIREEMARDVDYDVDLFAEMVRSGVRPIRGPMRVIRGFKSYAPAQKVSDQKSATSRSKRKAGK